MADFVQKSVSKTAVREWIAPLTIANINALVSEITGAGNPFETSGYVQSGENLPGAAKSRESYTGMVVYENPDGRIVGTIALRTKTQEALNAAVPRLVADAPLANEMGGEPVRDTEKEAYSVGIRCHDEATDEFYTVTIGRKRMAITSYSDDGILSRIETWADGKANLN